MSKLGGSIAGVAVATMIGATAPAFATPAGFGAFSGSVAPAATLVHHGFGGFGGHVGGFGRFGGGPRFTPNFAPRYGHGPVAFSGNWGHRGHRRGFYGYPFYGFYGGGYPYYAYDNYYYDSYDDEPCFYSRRLHATVCPDGY